MAMQLKTITSKILKLSTMTSLRNHSRISIPSIFWQGPFRRHRSEFWNKSKPFDVISPFRKNIDGMGYRMPSMNYWEDERFTANPEDGFHVSVNVEHFLPNEVNVKVVDKSIVVEAKHVQQAENGQSYTSRHFTRRYVFPDGFDLTEIVSTLSSDGVLTIVVPPKRISQQNVRNITIEQTGTHRSRNPGHIKGPDRQEPKPKERDEPEMK